MADGYISQIKTPDNKVYDFRDQHLKVYTGSCTTAAGTAIKDVTTDGEFTLAKGAVIFVNFSATNTAAVADLKLRVNSNVANDAKPIKHEYNASEANLPGVGYLRANQTYQFYYDGTNWVTDVGRDANSTYSYMRPYENTGKGSYNSQGENPVKTGAAGWKFQLSAGKYFMYSHYYDNTAKSALTLNIGSTGAKPIYINGQPSSADNYTLPGGQYLVYYDGTNYYFRTDDKMTGNITGNAATASSIALSGVTGADDLQAIEALTGTSGLLKKTAANTWTLDTNNYVTSSGITSITIGATSPVQSSTSTAQTGSSASTTISLKDAYGDTKNPYGTKTKNLVLAGPSSGNAAAPSFRALVAADIPALAYVPAASGANDVNTLVNTGIYNITSGSLTNGPTGYGFGQLLVMSYRKHTGNTTTDWATQIYAHLGSGNNGNTLYYRTSNASTWQTWQMVAHTDAATAMGNAKKPIYINAKGEIQEGDTLKNLAYKDSLTSSDIPDNAANTTGNAATSTSAKYLYPFNDGTNVSGTTNISILQTIQNSDDTPRSVPFGVKLQHGNTEVGFGYFYPKSSLYGGWYIASYGGPSYVAVTNGTWETYKILTSNNTAAGSNNAAALAWNTTYTIAKINNVDIKFTTMAKPSYTFTDLTEHPTTLSGYGITDAAEKNHSHTLTIGNKSLSVSTSEQEWTVHDILKTSINIGTDTSWDQTAPGAYYVASGSAFTGTGHPGTNQEAPYSYGGLYVLRAGNGGAAQFYISDAASGGTNKAYGIRYRSGWNVINNTAESHWRGWATILDDKNFNLYAPTLTGTGASGSWGISVTGTAANVTGTVAIEHGGTGTTTASAAANALISELPIWTATPTADTYFIRRDTTGTATFGQVKFSSIANITNNTLRLGPYSSTLVTSVNGNIGDVTITAADLGLHTPLSFVGVVAVNSAYQPSNGTQGTPTIVGMQEYTPASGDVILDKDSLREYVYANDVWTLLGYTASQIYDSDNIAVGLAPEDVPTWISKVTQATDGSIQVERKTIGVLPIAHGGTGASSFSANAVIISTSPSAGETMTLTSRAYSDSDQAGELSSTSTNFVTERDIYFGLPQINNLHNYTSGDGIYAPTTSGEQYQLLVSNNTNTEKAPVWTPAAWLQSDVNASADVAAYTTLTLGNQINVTSATAHSEGQIQLYSAATHAHIIKGMSTNTLDYTHILPNSDGVLVQTSSAGAVGGPTQPVYVDANNIITAIEYTPNVLYYSASRTSFEATGHYASPTQICLGISTLPENNTDTLYVNGTTTHNGSVYFANGTTYYIDNYAVGFFPDLRVDKIQLDDDTIKFYSSNNAGESNGSLYASIQSTQDYMHFLLSNGTVDTTPTFDFNGHLLPSTDRAGDLGSSTSRWAHLYLGTDDTYGDAYTPVYWNDGAPATVVPVQYCQFTIKSSTVGVMLTHEAFTENSYVLQIVVTSGESNLNSPIRWASYSSGELALFCFTPPSGDVRGYILVSRGDSITPQSVDLMRLPPPPDAPPPPPPPPR